MKNLVNKQIRGSEKSKSRYLGLAYLSLFLVILGRIYESITLNNLFNPAKLWKSEALGLMQDIFLCIGILWLLYPLYRYLFDNRGRNKLFLFELFLIIFAIAHIGILEYFFYQMEPLDVFLFGHQTTEMAFSLSTSGLSFKRLFIALACTVIVLILGIYYYKRLHFKTKYFEYLRWIGMLGLGVFIYFDLYGKFPVASDLIKNKSYYFYYNILKDRSKRFVEPNVDEWAPKFQKEYTDKKYVSTEFPFLHEFEIEDGLSRYLNKFETSPNIVVLLTESLSEYFIHPIRGMHFMPFLDSLSKNSLYWPNHLSLGERSFAANPAINASVPYGDQGFSLMETYPYHFSLINVLQKNGYLSSFYYGQGSWFHNKQHFFKFNNIDRIIDKNEFASHYEKVLVGEEKNFWGYNDIDLFNQYLEATDSLINRKRLDIIFTGTSHAPFLIKNPDRYNHRFHTELEKIKNPEDIEHFNLYKRFYLSLYNVDDAYRNLFDSLQKRSDYNNTIYILTGDHAMTELPRAHAMSAYKVPLMIISPKLKQAKKFEEICSHNDIYETLLSYLNKQYDIDIPKISSALGEKIKFEEKFNPKETYVFMNNNRQIVDIYSDGYYLFKDRYLFKVYEDLELREIIDRDIRKKLRDKLYSFKAASQLASKNFKLMPDSLYFNFFDYKVYSQTDLKDSLIQSNKNVMIDSLELPYSEKIYYDISIQILSENSAFPSLEIEIYDHNKILIQTEELKFPIDKINYQFHHPIQLKPSKNNYLIKTYLKNVHNEAFSFTKLRCAIYGKKGVRD